MFDPHQQIVGGAPKAVRAAKGAGIASMGANATSGTYNAPPRHRKRVVHAIGPAGPIAVTGQEARALEALIESGAAGVTSLEVSSWAYRLGAYIFDLRHDYGLSIDTLREEHDDGWHARYVLRTPVVIADAVA
ncbi:winged helix domain-containing protein [Sphingomonas sp. AAP5]|uniref:winged helix domain-containing protein n=1 Tax=Sphingomonas sp. AAP5 TaxID=1523415 RepID=UPI0019D1CF76|nr:hypothetical protein [Sphingomonas sp. AAP5]